MESTIDRTCFVLEDRTGASGLRKYWRPLLGALGLAILGAALHVGLGAKRHAAVVVPYPHELAQVSFAVSGDVIPHEAVKAAAAHEGPVFLRISRFGVPDLPRPADAVFAIGKAETLSEGRDVAIIANGVMVARALEASASLATAGVSARVINMASIAPLDVEAIRSAANLGAIVTVEEHSVRGGLGGAVAEVVAGYRPCPIRILGFPGFMPTGSVSFLFERYGLTAAGIATAAREAMGARA